MYSEPSRITNLLGIKYPIIQAGMVWVSGAKLAAAASEAGCLGVLGAGSMSGDLLRQHIRQMRQSTSKPFAVNFPIMYSGTPQQIEIALEEGVKIYILSAGSPRLYTTKLQECGAIVMHVCASPRLARKCEDAGVDVIIAEGFEAGGHNGRDELTTMVLIPQVVAAVSCPVVAAGGIAHGSQMLAAMALGADAVQVGSRFAASEESSAHLHFKEAICDAAAEDTLLMMKALAPVRLLKNSFYQQVQDLEDAGGSAEELQKLLGKGRARAGMFEGDMVEGELEIGQVSGMIHDIPKVKEIVQRMIQEYESVRAHLPSTS